MKTKPKTLGRHDLAGAREPAGGYAIPALSINNARTGVVAVPDPWDQTGKARIRTVARFSVLDEERSRGRITEGAYRVGTEVERTFEGGQRIGCGGAWRHGDRVDAATATKLAIDQGLIAAKKVNDYLGWLVLVLGRRDARILSKILGDRKSFLDVATDEGKGGDRGMRYIAMRFRDALEQLSNAQAAHGRERGSR